MCGHVHAVGLYENAILTGNTVPIRKRNSSKKAGSNINKIMLNEFT